MSALAAITRRSFKEHVLKLINPGAKANNAQVGGARLQRLLEMFLLRRKPSSTIPSAVTYCFDAKKNPDGVIGADIPEMHVQTVRANHRNQRQLKSREIRGILSSETITDSILLFRKKGKSVVLEQRNLPSYRLTVLQYPGEGGAGPGSAGMVGTKRH